MAYRYRKPYRIKKKKSILGNRFFRLGILVLVITGGILYFIFFSGIFKIEKIIITGQGTISEESIKAFIGGSNIFLVDIKKTEKDILDNFPQIAEAKISRSFPDALNILVTERSAAALWCEEKCFLIDREGVIFGDASGAVGFINISGMKDMLNKEKISQILEIQAKLEEGPGVTTTQAMIVSDERLNMKTSEKWEIYFNLKGDLDWQIQELKLVLEKQIPPEKRRNLEYIDLRFSRVYIK
ncbi:MAG: FtsQ-type POTRA domain-containing protein [Candidatus Nealsonbacteria bacterium]|nr:FtsQ-type POTRA domain-containing protein [Candidatus Nealsonbacteria bacterium]